MSKKRVKVCAGKRKERQVPARRPSPRSNAGQTDRAPRPEAKAAAAPGGDHRMSSIRATGVPAGRLPGPGAEGVESIPLPWRERLEARLRRPLAHLEVLTGPAVASALDSLGATAATRGQRIYLADPGADFGTVAHEVVHALQVSGEPLVGPKERTNEGEESTGAGSASAEAEGHVVEADAPAEQEAARVAERLAVEGAGSDMPPLEQSLEPGDVALLRVTDPASDPAARLDQALSESGPSPENGSSSEKKASVSEPAVESASESASEPSAESVPELEPSPTFDLPAMPATELSADELAARQQEKTAALAAIDQAEGASGTVGAFADAPPSVKAMAQGTLGGKIDGAVQNEEADFSAGVPEFHAEMGGTPLDDQEGAPEVATPEIGEVKLEDGTPAPDHQPELPPTEDKGKFLANNAVVSFFSSLFGGGGGDDDGERRAEAIGKSLDKIETTDSEIDTSPGAKPKVAQEGETDPQRIDDQKGAGREQARGARDEAAQAVVDGPGPEQAQLRKMDEIKTVGELKRPQVEGVASASGAERFQQLAMPEEVNAQFDADRHGAMRDSMAEAQGAMEGAESERDTGREQALAEAESDRQTLMEEADGEQRGEVLEARKSIQTERQSTLEAQADGVRDLETEAETKSRDNRSQIKTRVTEDEEAISGRYDKAEGEAEGKMVKGEEDAETERKKSEEESKNTSWWDRLKSWVKEQFAKLTAAIGKIFDAVRAAIKTALDAVRDFAKGLIDAVASFIKEAIAAFGEMLKGLVDVLLADLFPELARKLKEKIDGAVETAQKAVDKVADDLKKGVDAMVDALQAGLNAILDVFQAAINFGLAVLAAAITGDWGEVAKMLLEAALKLVGIDPEEFYAYVGKAMDVIGLIIDAPGTFLLNCVNAVMQGFESFAGNFFTHLKAGIIKWLTGAMGDLVIPEKFDFFGVLDLGRQIMGLTWEWLRGKAVKVIGEENVERVEYIFDYVDTLREEGWGGLFQRIMEDLTGLAGMILGQVRDFMVVKLITAAVTWIASLFSPVGAIVKLLFTVWNLFLFLKDQLMRIAGIVKSVIDGIANVAHGVLGPAAAKVEEAMANLLPVAIDLIMKLLGITGVSQRVKGVIEGIRERVDKAADKLIAKAMKLFKPKKKKKSDDAAAATAAAESKGSGEIEVGEPMTIERPGEDALLFIDVEGKEATVMIKASPARPIVRWLKATQEKLDKSKPLKKRHQPTLTKAFTELRQLDGASSRLAAAKRVVASGKEPEASKAKARIPALTKKVDQRQTALHTTLAALMGKSPTLRGSSATDPWVVIFETDVGKAHPDAQIKIRKEIRRLGSEDWLRWRWRQVQEALIADHATGGKLFARPLKATNGKFAQNLRDKLIADLKGREGTHETIDCEDGKDPKDVDYPAKADVRNFVTNYVAKPLDEGTEPAVLAGIQAAIFKKKSHANLVKKTLPPLIFAGLERWHKSKSKKKRAKPTQRFLDAIKAAGSFYGLLKGIALGGKFNGIDRFNWKIIAGHKGNKEEIGTRFRALKPRTHEWIPTRFVADVVHRASRLPVSASPALWIEMQDEFRAPTKGIIFKPDSADRTRKIKGRPGSGDATKNLTVLQGHPGAVYAPVDDKGYADEGGKPKAKQQTKTSNTWHQGLNAIYTESESAPTTASALYNIWMDVGKLFLNTVWDGKQAPSDPFDEYYAARGVGKPRLTFNQVRNAYVSDYYKKTLKGFQKAEAVAKKAIS
ncbi:MAG: DUF4157 domain-containing protein [bacterium]|nr:DUF4157 domain-containing protein [bacterium]